MRRRRLNLNRIPGGDLSVENPQHCDRQALREELEWLLAALGERYQRVLSLRYGFTPNGLSYSLDEIARLMRCRRERVAGLLAIAHSRLHHRAGRLRCFLE